MEPVDQNQDTGEFQHPPVLQNETPNVVTSTYSIVTGLLQVYGWYILIAVIALIYIKSKLTQHVKKMRENESVVASKKYDANEVYQRHEAMEAARQRMQNQHENMAASYAEEEKNRQEEKRLAKIQDWERHQSGKGYRSKVRMPEADQTAQKPPTKKKQVYRSSEYNPLDGSSGGGSAGFRPARRSGAGGG